MDRYFLKIIMIGVLFFSIINNTFADETIGCPHDVGKGNVKIRLIMAPSLDASKCYSDEVWEALRENSPYPMDYDKMVNLPEGWHYRETKIALGIEYGIIDRLSLGIFSIYDIVKDIRRQVWSEEENKPVWEEIKDNGPEDIWISAKYLAFTKPPIWKEGLFLGIAYKPSITSDEKIKHEIASGTNDFKLAVSSHPHFTEYLFATGEIWYHHRGRVRDIDGFEKSGWNLGDKFGYWAFLGYEFLNHKFVVISGLHGWITEANKDSNGNQLEDSDTYSHGIVIKFRWQPFGEEDAGSIMLLARIPYANKTTFMPGPPSSLPMLWGMMKFNLFGK